MMIGIVKILALHFIGILTSIKNACDVDYLFICDSINDFVIPDYISSVSHANFLQVFFLLEFTMEISQGLNFRNNFLLNGIGYFFGCFTQMVVVNIFKIGFGNVGNLNFHHYQFSDSFSKSS